MPKRLTSIKIAENIREKFSLPVPLLLSADTRAIKLELKPYLQPFERELAHRELLALLRPGERVIEKYGYYMVETKAPEELLRERLTYWQRVGKLVLEPTVQESLEFTQNGLSDITGRRELHKARRLRYGPHDLHEYRGKFFPQLVRSIINISGIPKGALVLDPMCGSGTTTCEALAAERSAIGVDLNPLSVLIARVKSAVVLERAEIFKKTVHEHLNGFSFKAPGDPRKAWSENDLGYLERWFDAQALRDLSIVLREIGIVRKPLYQDFYRVCLSSIIRSVSWQKGVDLRVRKQVDPYDRGAAITRFKDEVSEQLDRIYPYLCVLPARSRKLALTIKQGNAVTISTVLPEYRGRVKLLITSPPYATALPYLDTDRLSLIVLGMLPRKQHSEFEAQMVGTREVSERQRSAAWDDYKERRSELPSCVAEMIDGIAAHNHGSDVGFRRRNLPALLGRYFLNMLYAMKSARQLMAPKGQGYYIVGNNSTSVDGHKIDIPTDRFLYEMGAVAGWKQVEMLAMDLLASRDIFKGNRGSAETILFFRT
jgi:hypothetical protein